MADKVVDLFSRKASVNNSTETATEASQLPGLSRCYIDLTPENVDNLKELAEKAISADPNNDLVMVFGFEVKVTHAKDFDRFYRLGVEVFDNIYNDVVLDLMLDLHNGIAEDSKQIFIDDMLALIARVKHGVSTDLCPIGSMVMQITVTSVGLVITMLYGTPGSTYAAQPTLCITFKDKDQ